MNCRLRCFSMAPIHKDMIQLTGADRNSPDGDELEDVRLLDSYDDADEQASANYNNSRRIQVRITGMTCSACSNSVEGALKSLNGVVKASVSLLQNKADVVFDSASVNVSFLFFLSFSLKFCCMYSCCVYICM